MSDPRGEPVPEPVLELINEFAEVQVRKVHTHNGVRLEITAPRLGTTIRLCPLQLEGLTRQAASTFSEMLAGSQPEEIQ